MSSRPEGWPERWHQKEQRGGDIPVEYFRGAVIRPGVGGGGWQRSLVFLA